MPFHGFERVMACTRADLGRWLAELTGADSGIAAAGRTELRFDWGVLGVETEPLPPRRIALLAVQQLRVRFVPPPGGEAHARAWIERFDHHTQRGGG
ncbi:MAG TPA: hypothetical protein VEA81_06320 [Burkholderiaceae bacterium]|nr:hypothetical protein [Burkholderiaceae bacterium]